MHKLILFLVSAFYLCLASCGAEPSTQQADVKQLEDITATIHTNDGDIEILLYASKTPVTVANFVTLAERGFWEGSNFHRIVQGFVSQGGKHKAGSPSPGYTIRNETYTENPGIAGLTHSKAGMLSMARQPANHTNGCQWYITHAATGHLDGAYTVFGEVTKGLEIALKLRQGTLIKDVKITSDSAPIKAAYKAQIATWNTTLDTKFDDLRKVEKE